MVVVETQNMFIGPWPPSDSSSVSVRGIYAGHERAAAAAVANHFGHNPPHRIVLGSAHSRGRCAVVATELEQMWLGVVGVHNTSEPKHLCILYDSHNNLCVQKEVVRKETTKLMSPRHSALYMRRQLSMTESL